MHRKVHVHVHLLYMQTNKGGIPGREEGTNEATEPIVYYNTGERGEHGLESMYKAFLTYLDVPTLPGSSRGSNGPSSTSFRGLHLRAPIILSVPPSCLSQSPL